jgi:hypothetical protein
MIRDLSSWQGKTVYHGGRLNGQPKPGLFVSQNKKYAEKFASQTDGVITKFILSPNTKIWPETYGWEQFKNLWQPNFKGYDAVRVIEPNGQGESLVVFNPGVLK